MVPSGAGSEVEAFRYGLLATEVSEALRMCADGREKETCRSAFKRGERLMDEIVAAQDAVSGGVSYLASVKAQFDIRAYRCALELIAENSEEFRVRNNEDLEKLFIQLRMTLRTLVEGKREELSPEDLRYSQLFFAHLAELMLNALSRRARQPEAKLLPSS